MMIDPLNLEAWPVMYRSVRLEPIIQRLDILNTKTGSHDTINIRLFTTTQLLTYMYYINKSKTSL